jgi:hypothetical protein
LPVPLPLGPEGYIAILTFVTTVLRARYEVHDRPYAMKTAHFFRSRDGMLCEHWGVRDELDVLYQIGALKPQEIAMPVPD